MKDTPKFICDAMLGRLAKKMRLLGFDVIYHNGEDREFARRAVVEKRIPITRDTQVAQYKIFRRHGLPVIFPTSDDYHVQLEEVISCLTSLGYQVESVLAERKTRCSLCNLELSKIRKLSACARVPAFVYLTSEDFYICAKCSRIYWQGTHVASYEKDLNIGLKKFVKRSENQITDKYI